MHNCHINHHHHHYHHHRRHTSGHCWRCVLWNVCLKLTTVEQTIKQLSPAFIIVYIALHRHHHLSYFDLEFFFIIDPVISIQHLWALGKDCKQKQKQIFKYTIVELLISVFNYWKKWVKIFQIQIWYDPNHIPFFLPG